MKTRRPVLVVADVSGYTTFAHLHRSLELTGECSMCVCDACRTAGTLRLKVIVHEGQAVITRLHGFEKLAGEDVIITQRLLKNSIPPPARSLSMGGLDRVTPECPRGGRDPGCLGSCAGEVAL